MAVTVSLLGPLRWDLVVSGPRPAVPRPFCSERSEGWGQSCPDRRTEAPLSRPLARLQPSCAPSSAAWGAGPRGAGRGSLHGVQARRPRLLRSAVRRETLRREQQEREQLSHPAHFGPRKYCLRECICEVEGQVPCPAVVPLPRELTGKFQAALRAGAQD